MLLQVFPDNKVLSESFDDLQAKIFSRTDKKKEALELMEKVLENAKERYGDGD